MSPKPIPIGRTESESFVLCSLQRPYVLPSEIAGPFHSLTLFVADPAVTADEQRALSCQIATLRPRWAICGGHGCASWDDSIDWADIDFKEAQEQSGTSDAEEHFILTTWHENESPGEVIEFTLTAALPDEAGQQIFLLVILGDDDKAAIQKEMVEAIARLRPQMERYSAAS